MVVMLHTHYVSVLNIWQAFTLIYEVVLIAMPSTLSAYSISGVMNHTNQWIPVGLMVLQAFSDRKRFVLRVLAKGRVKWTGFSKLLAGIRLLFPALRGTENVSAPCNYVKGSCDWFQAYLICLLGGLSSWGLYIYNSGKSRTLIISSSSILPSFCAGWLTSFH